MVLPKKITRKIKRATRSKLAHGEKYGPEIRAAWAREGRESLASGTLSVTGLAPEAERAFHALVDGIIPADEVTERMRRAFALENMLKNVAIRQIVEIRAINEKPSLKEAVKQILARQSEEDAKKRRKLKKKLTREYEDNAAKGAGHHAPESEEDPDENDDIGSQKKKKPLPQEDGLFNRVVVGMDRLLKVLTSHSAAVDSLEKKLNEISAAKKKAGRPSHGGPTAGETQLTEGMGLPPPGEDKMFQTGELEGFEAYGDEDNLDFIEQADLDRDQFMEELKQGYEPDEQILAPYRIPVETQKRLHINSDGESLADITSEESEDPEIDLGEDGDGDNE